VRGFEEEQTVGQRGWSTESLLKNLALLEA
jgi:hypothetical protein